MKYFKKLIGELVYLSPMNIEDAEKYTEWMNDMEITDYIGRTVQVISIECEKEFITDTFKGNQNKVVLSIIDKKTDTLIGNISLNNINYIRKTATLGIFIGENREKGYGTDAIKLILDYGFNYLNLKNIDLQVISCNTRAIKCYEKCGFKKYGSRRNSSFINGKYYNTDYMDILCDEFNESYIENKNVK